MNSESRKCQNCKQQFTIEPEDFQFYEKVSASGGKVPPPTFCFDCRVQRRMAFRNERNLYKRPCNVPGHTEQIISIFSGDKPQRVFDQQAWWGDSWDGTTYGREVDFSTPFFTQLQKLWAEVPDIALLNINQVNSEYCSITEGNKNCYLVIGGDFNENSMYSTYVFRSKECLDTYWVSDSELNYETVDCISCSRLTYSRYCKGCYDAAFLFNCKNCHDCFGCVNLKNASYRIWNVQYTKEEYEKKRKEINLRSAREVEKIREQFAAHILKFPRRFAYIVRAANSTGDNLDGTKNCRKCFDVFGGGEDCTYLWLAYSKVSDCMDTDRAGLNAELIYETSTAYPGNGVYFSRFVFSSRDIFYSYNIHNSDHCFGCVGLRDRHYCILNKQYSKEEWEQTVVKLIKHMNAMPLVIKRNDGTEIIYKFGEFFPAEISPFAYNETVAQEIAPLTREETLAKGLRWKEQKKRKYAPTLTAEIMPDTIDETRNAILNDVIECVHKGGCNDQCTQAFKLIPEELTFYRRMGVPIPRLCPNCRHYRRLRQRNPIRLWIRKCQCGGTQSENGVYKNSVSHHHGPESCSESFETSYAPDRPEIVYCEVCYQAEVA